MFWSCEIAQDSEDWESQRQLWCRRSSLTTIVALMNGLQPVLAWANFTRTDLTDAGLAGLDGFDQLRSLRLAQTAIGDGGVDALLKLQKLEVLNLYAIRASPTPASFGSPHCPISRGSTVRRHAGDSRGSGGGPGGAGRPRDRRVGHAARGGSKPADESAPAEEAMSRNVVVILEA